MDLSNMTAVAIVIILLVFALAGWLWLEKRTRGPKPPRFPGELPILGHTLQVLVVVGNGIHIWNKIKKIHNYSLEHDGVVVFRICNHELYFVTDPDDCATVASTCYDKPFMYEFGKPIFGDALLTSKEKIWKEDRKLIKTGFGQQTILMFNQIFNLNAKNLTAQLNDEVGKSSIDVWQHILLSIVKGVCGTTLGLDYDDVITEHYAENMDQIVQLMVNRFQNPLMFLTFIYNISSNKKLLEKNLEKIKSITDNIIEDRKRKLYKPEEITQDYTRVKTFLDIMIKQGSFTHSQLREHSDLMIVASYDTVHHALIFTLLLIGSYQKVQERIYKELQDVFETSETYVDKYELSKLVYLEAVIKESMRIYPPVPMVARKVDKDVQLRNYVIPKDSTFVMCIHGMHRHPMWGTDVEQFRPERWLEPGGVPDHNNAYGPFSLGKRNCIGQQYAMNLMKIYLAHIIRKYRVTANMDDVIIKYQLFIKPSFGHELVLDPREH